MDSKRFDDEGKLIIPEVIRRKKDKQEGSEFEIPEIIKETRTFYIIRQAFCPNGHNLIDKKHVISGYPGIRLRYKRKDNSKAEIVISAVLGDSQKIILQGNLTIGELVEIHCPICDVKLPILTHYKPRKGEPGYSKNETVDIVALYLTPELDYSKAISFCNKVGVVHSSIKYAHEIIRDIYKQLPDFG